MLIKMLVVCITDKAVSGDTFDVSRYIREGKFYHVANETLTGKWHCGQSSGYETMVELKEVSGRRFQGWRFREYKNVMSMTPSSNDNEDYEEMRKAA